MIRSTVILTAASLPLLLLGACQPGAKTTMQNGPRGSAMDTIEMANQGPQTPVPAPPYTPPGTDGPRASTMYKNLKVLGNVSADQLGYTMAAITQWVAPPDQGCNYCHNPANMASDEKYTKVVARRMLQMTRHINGEWKDHVGQVGVTCWTCHRGNQVPTEHWTLPQPDPNGIVGNRHGQDAPESITGYSSLPNTALAEFLLGPPGTDPKVRIQSTTAHPNPHDTLSVMQSEPTYALMMHISKSLGVNCTFCHNTQSFQNWSTSNPQRVTAYYGIRMARDINSEYISSIANVLPASLKGPMGDPYKVDCATCHQGQNKPMGGFPMAKDYPALWGDAPAPAPAATDAPVAAAAAPETAAPAPAK